jgi:hypothetical protein
MEGDPRGKRPRSGSSSLDELGRLNTAGATASIAFLLASRRASNSSNTSKTLR